ncbi:MAG: DUF5689 domain-containing protein [Cyclobacteriaceae bacterium]|nr:T9SS type A sorting domain-containing protein [Cyclobacteriaceae bacterium]MCH8515301.1 DUF5689 domain-containing protein [Cyclobacteriaceae bacterium]
MNKIYLGLITLLLLYAQLGWAQETIFLETFDASSATGTQTLENTTFDNPDFTFEGNTDSRTSLQSTGYQGASGLRNIFFGTASGILNRNFSISGINTEGYTDIKLSFGQNKTPTDALNDMVIEVSIDGEVWNELTYTREPDQTGWILIETEGIIPATENLHIRWRKDSDTQWRIDDILLTGTSVSDPSSPTLTVNTTGFNGDFGFVNAGSSSEPSTFVVNGANLEAEFVLVSVDAPFEVSAISDAGYNQTISLMVTDGDISQDVFVRFSPTEATGDSFDTNITISADGIERTLALSGTEGEIPITSIADARALANGEVVTVEGLVIGGPNNDNTNRIINDGTGGITIRQGSGEFATGSLALGTRVRVSGTMATFRNARQIETLTDLEILEEEVDLPVFEVATISQIRENLEGFKGALVTLENVIVTDDRTEFEGGGPVGSFAIAQGDDVLTFRIGTNTHPLVGTNVPSVPVNISGFIGRFNDDIRIFVNDENGIVEIPNLTVNLNDFNGNFGSTLVNEVSPTSSFILSANNLEDDITFNIPAAFQLSLTEDFTETFDDSTPLVISDDIEDGSLESTTIFVRFAPDAAQEFSGNLLIESDGAAVVNIALNGGGIEPGQPVITPNLDSFSGDFGTIVQDSELEIRSYLVSGVDLTENLVISVSEDDFLISLTGGQDFDGQAEISLPAAEGIVEETTIFVRLASAAEVGIFEAEISHTSAGATTRIIELSAMIEEPTEVTSIAEARQLDNGEVVTVEGLVIGGPLNETTSRTINDGTAGILIFQGGATNLNFTGNLALGTRVRVTGTTATERSGKRIGTITELEILETDVALPDFEVATVAQLTEDTESFTGKLVTLENVIFTDDRTEFVGGGPGGSFAIAQGEDAMIFRIGNAAHPLVGTAVPGVAVNISGYIGTFDDDIQIFANDENGIERLEVEPLISLDLGELENNFGAVDFGESSASQSYVLSATGLNEAVSITAPVGFELSLSDDFVTDVVRDGEPLLIEPTADGEIEETTIFIRFTPTALEQSARGSVEHVSEGAVTQSFNVQGRETTASEVITIAEAATLEPGTQVTVEGLVIGGPNNDNTNRIINDGTGGITIRQTGSDNPNFTGNLELGTSVRVTGTISLFGGSPQIETLTLLEVLEEGLDLPEFTTLTIEEINADLSALVGSLVRIEEVLITREDEGTVFVGGGAPGNHIITRGESSMIFRIGNSAHPLAGENIPSEAVTLEGYIGSFNGAAQIFVNDENGLIGEIPAPPSFEVSEVPAAGFNLGIVQSGNVSRVVSFQITAANLDLDAITITAPAGFEFSLEEEGTFENEISISLTDGNVDRAVFLRFNAASIASGAFIENVVIDAGEFGASFRVIVEVTPILSISDLAQRVVIYPNPARGHLNIDTDLSIQKVSILDLNGRILRNIDWTSEQSNISLDGFAEGIYHIILQNDQNKISKKLIIRP